MGGLKDNTSDITFVNIRDGRLTLKLADGNYKAYGSLGGVIKKVAFGSYTAQNNVSYETLKVIIDNEGEAFQLEMFTDSRYFLSMCNFLKTSNPLVAVEVSPREKVNEHGKKVQTMFVKQNGKSLSAAHTKDNMGDLPPLEPVAGQTYLNNSKQVAYWKAWMIATYGEFKTNAPAVADNQGTANNSYVNNSVTTEPLDDLPF